MKYIITRVIVAFVAIHTLDVSIDIDHITAGHPWFNAESYDDIDSVSELVIETIYHDTNLVKESDHDDQRRGEKQASQYSTVVLYVKQVEAYSLPPVADATLRIKPHLTNTKLFLEDFSRSSFTPPDYSLS